MSQETRCVTHTGFFNNRTPSSTAAVLTRKETNSGEGGGTREEGGKEEEREEEEEGHLHFRVRKVEDGAFQRPSWCHELQEIRIFCLTKSPGHASPMTLGPQDEDDTGGTHGHSVPWGSISLGVKICVLSAVTERERDRETETERDRMAWGGCACVSGSFCDVLLCMCAQTSSGTSQRREPCHGAAGARRRVGAREAPEGMLILDLHSSYTRWIELARC